MTIVESSTGQRFLGLIVLLVVLVVIVPLLVELQFGTPEVADYETVEIDSTPAPVLASSESDRQAARKIEMLNEMLMLPGGDRPLEDEDMTGTPRPTSLRVLDAPTPLPLTTLDDAQAALVPAPKETAAQSDVNTAPDAESTAAAPATSAQDKNNADVVADLAQAQRTLDAAAPAPAASQPEPTVIEAVAEKPPKRVAAAPRAVPRPAAKAPPKAAQWWVQVASFGSRASAEEYQSRLAGMQLPLRVHSASAQGRPVFRVQIGPFDEGRAVQAKERLRGRFLIDGILVQQ